MILSDLAKVVIVDKIFRQIPVLSLNKLATYQDSPYICHLPRIKRHLGLPKGHFSIYMLFFMGFNMRLMLLGVKELI